MRFFPFTLAADREYKENEIFPQSDVMEDWLQLLDYPPENVASVKPIGRNPRPGA